MSNPTSDVLFRRIVTILDATSDHSRALASAATLARRFDTDLVTVFFENRRLLQLEGHPLARGIDLPTGLGHAIERGSMRRSGRALARRLQRQMNRLARSHQVQARFEHLRDDVETQLREYVGNTDLVVVEKAGRCIAPHVRIRSQCHALAQDSTATVLFSAPHGMLRSVAVVYDGSPTADRALDAALQLGARRSIAMTLFLVGSTGDEGRKLQQKATDQIAERGIEVHLHTRRITSRATPTIVGLTSALGAQLLIVPDTEEHPDDEAIEHLTEQLECPVLLLRSANTPVDEKTRRQMAMEN